MFKKIRAAVTMIELFDDPDPIVTKYTGVFKTGVRDEDDYELAKKIAAYDIATRLAKEVACHYDGVVEIAKPWAVAYNVMWDGMQLNISFVYSKIHKRYALSLGNIEAPDYLKYLS